MAAFQEGAAFVERGMLGALAASWMQAVRSLRERGAPLAALPLARRVEAAGLLHQSGLELSPLLRMAPWGDGADLSPQASAELRGALRELLPLLLLDLSLSSDYRGFDVDVRSHLMTLSPSQKRSNTVARVGRLAKGAMRAAEKAQQLTLVLPDAAAWRNGPGERAGEAAAAAFAEQTVKALLASVTRIVPGVEREVQVDSQEEAGGWQWTWTPALGDSFEGGSAEEVSETAAEARGEVDIGPGEQEGGLRGSVGAAALIAESAAGLSEAETGLLRNVQILEWVTAALNGKTTWRPEWDPARDHFKAFVFLGRLPSRRGEGWALRYHMHCKVSL
jgi:hypothetical protein